MESNINTPSVEGIEKLLHMHDGRMMAFSFSERQTIIAAVRQLAEKVEEWEKNDKLTADYIQATHDKIHRIEAERDAAREELAKKQNNIEEFCWGKKTKLEQKEPLYIVDHLELKAGGFSSIHAHQVQYNFMFVIFGKLNIELYRQGVKSLYLEKTLGRNDFMRIPPETVHRFRALEDSLVIEIITADGTNIVSRDDIIRLTERGIYK